ncbi:seminal metalloprotease 1-like isoform X2 [Lycorma delicatula]|uniref:seminal metalloprotease 1-like isoform X2 n=1 Tax=Lycorma delicatula TaxID=130591 RepID=UPI003F51A976
MDSHSTSTSDGVKLITAVLKDKISIKRNSLGKGYYPELSSGLFQGDIFLPLEMETRNAITLDKYKWPNRTVPYKFTSNYNYTADVHDNEHDDNYILINKIQNRGCYAVVGYRSDISPIPVNFMSPECFKSNGTIQHELLHVLGLLHEQARPDRDEYVQVLWQNVDERHRRDFSKAPSTFVSTYNVSYNLNSVMHYPNMAFSKNGKPTMISKKNSKELFGQRDGAVDGDFEKVRQIYKCNN